MHFTALALTDVLRAQEEASFPEAKGKFGIETEIRELKITVAESNNRIGALEAENRELKATVAELKAENRELKATVAELK